jgi:cbb3-type cytochrome oxidase cytochrome c subunit
MDQAEEIAITIVDWQAGEMKKLGRTLTDAERKAKIKKVQHQEVVALIAYLQRLGIDIKADDAPAAKEVSNQAPADSADVNVNNDSIND